MPTPTIDRRAIWKRLMDRAAASQRTPTVHEPAGYEFSATMTPELVESMPQEAQTELALQLSKLVLDTSRTLKKRVIDPPKPIDVEAAKRGLRRLFKTGRLGSRQGPAIMMAIREGAVANPVPSGSTPIFNVTRIEHIPTETAMLVRNCDYCGVGVTDPTTLHAHGTGLICNVCHEHDTTECPSCHAREYWHEMRRGPTTPVCRTCAERLMTNCPSCGETTARGTVRNGTCPSCVRARFIHPYNHKPAPAFFVTPEDPMRTTTYTDIPCLGVELETELPRRIQNAAVHAYEATEGVQDLIYAKHDGSLNYGVEYVSHPFSWAWLQAGGKARWAGFLEKLRGSQHTSYDAGTCGMHVHVSKQKYLGQPLLRLLNLANSAPQLILQLSRRNESELVQWANPRGGTPALFDSIARGVSRSPSKYTAINVTEPTIEFRLFRGTLNTTGFFANLEATKAMLDFCSHSTAPVSATNFLGFVESNPQSYPNLIGAILRTTEKV